jgi:hypothetical protein
MAEKVTEKKLPRVAVLERRLQNPFGEPSAEIQVKTPGMKTRIFNSAVGSDHIWRAEQKGWEKVKFTDIQDADQAGGFTASPDGFAVRGERGQEIVMQMPVAYWDRIIEAKDAHNRAKMANPHASKQDVMNAVSGRFGEQAAGMLNVTTMRTDKEIVERREE